MKVEQFKNRWYKLLFLIIGVSVIVFYALRGLRADLETYSTEIQTVPKNVHYCDQNLQKLQHEESEFIGNLVFNLFEKNTISQTDEDKFNSLFDFESCRVYSALRAEGRKLSEAWGSEESPFQSLSESISSARSKLQSAQIIQVNSIEIDLGFNFTVVEKNDNSAQRYIRTNISRGLIGLELSFGEKVKLYSPTYSVVSNRKAEKLIQIFKSENKTTDDEFEKSGRIRYFDAVQLLVTSNRNAFFMERGNSLISLSSVTKESTDKTAVLASNWLVNNIHHDGRMTYKYWPSNGKESESNNMIRQWMATVALGRSADFLKDDGIRQIEAKNIQFNLDKFFKREGEFGLIEFNGKVKLGAVALAALAIIEHPNREKWKNIETSLINTVRKLWNENGSFDTFYKPAGRKDNQNFYPGEALLLLSSLYEESKDNSLLEQIMKSFRYYRSWHLDASNRNPAFIPWHTQAYYKIWKLTKNPELRDFIFEMNDWLLNIQQWKENPDHCDIQGRFYDPDHPYGPPHASSTGVYLEGLIDAFNLAREVRDLDRMEKYKLAIRRGIRSVQQLQFQDEIDMFYTSWNKRNYVKGGIRTTVYNNEIRCDNVQHNLMGLIKILESFQNQDFE